VRSVYLLVIMKMSKVIEFFNHIAMKLLLDKAWLVSKGFSQVEGIDYDETFSPIAKMNSISLVLALVVSHKWDAH
jgi:hypothetical protein